MFDELEDCAEGPRVLAAWEDDDLSAVGEHVSTCASCRELLATCGGLQRALQVGDPGAGLKATASDRRVALLKECRDSLRPAPMVQRRPLRWIWPAAAGFAAAGLAMLFLHSPPRRSDGIVAPPAAPQSKVPNGAPAARAAAGAVVAPPELDPPPSPQQHVEPGRRDSPGWRRRLSPRRERSFRQIAAAPSPRINRPSAGGTEEKPPLVVVEAEGGAPAPYTVTVTATGSSVVTHAGYQETQP